jgi:predicted acyltransferase
MPARLASLDAFRGLTIAGMVLVNNPGTWSAIYAPLEHAAWHGLTPTDVIFPFFLFIVGVAIALSPPAPGRLLRRAAIIFALGLVLNALWDASPATLRIPGVLQRIAVCYLVAAALFLTTSARAQIALSAVLLAGYWLVLRGDLGPEGNVAARLDRAVLGAHVWRVSRVYDPEGILSTVPAVVTTLLGVLTGRWLAGARPPAVVVRGLVLGGAAGVIAGAVWSVWFPLNKSLWTSSYVLLTAGLALLGLAACYWTIEMRGWRRWAAPFVVLGVNALALYVLSSAAAIVLVRTGVKGIVFARVFAPWAAPIDASLAYAAAYLLVWWALMWGLGRAGIRLRA